MENLLVNQLDGVIEIPEVLHFTCNDRSQLLDQLKVLQMVLRKERDKNKEVSSGSSSTIQSSSSATSGVKNDLKEKVERHKKLMEQRKQDKLKQMDKEAQALARALDKEERMEQNSETIKVSTIGKR